MGDNNFDEEERDQKKRGSRAGSSLALLIATNILTFTVAGFIGPMMERKIMARKDISVYGNKKLEMVEQYVRKNYLREVNEKDLVDGKLKGVLASLKDPYSVYMTEDEFTALKEETHGAFGGVGVVVSVDMDREMIVVIAPVEGSPGDRAGIRAGDYIVEIDGRPYDGKSYIEAVKAMKGEVGTEVSLKLVRKLGQDQEETREVKIVREEIRTHTVKGQMMDDKIGYIKLSSFDEKTYDEFKDSFKALEEEGLEAAIIDLRDNPGGLLNVTRNIADMFLDKGYIVYTENRDGHKEYLKSNKEKIDCPLVVLVDGGSASASEILAGALKDRDRATIVGSQTFGKGVVQRIEDLGDGTGLKLTISEYFTPSGTKIDGVGISPDIMVDIDQGVEKLGPDNLDQDSQLKAGLEVLKKQLK